MSTHLPWKSFGEKIQPYSGLYRQNFTARIGNIYPDDRLSLDDGIICVLVMINSPFIWVFSPVDPEAIFRHQNCMGF